MRRHVGTSILLLASALASCKSADKPGFGAGGDPRWDDSVPDTGDTGGDTGDSHTGDSHTGDTGQETYFDDPGDVVEYTAYDTKTEVVLADASGDSNKDQEFFLVLVNPENDGVGFQLRYDEATTTKSRARAARRRFPAEVEPAATPWRAALREAIWNAALPPPEPGPLPPPYDDEDIGTTSLGFYVRESLEDGGDYQVVEAILAAVGDSVIIWVDADTRIDWDYDCDGVIDEVNPYNSFGFDNCDLQTVADIVDTNIIPNIRSLYGEESDVNADGHVSIVITPELNKLSLQSEDEDERGRLVSSYADPEVDLNEYDATTNPGSNYQEVVFLAAPDPYGHYNYLAKVDVSEYTSMSMASQVARAYTRLVLYNTKVLEGEGTEDETWVLEGLGALASDLTGFGAVLYEDVWDYLDAPHLTPLVLKKDGGAVSTGSWGSQYLFFRYLVDRFGTDVLSPLAGRGYTGTESVENAVAEVAGEDVDFEELALDWHVAMLTTGLTNSDGDSLVDPAEYPPFESATTLTAPTSDPSSGDYYGANGYQQGINIAGVNRFMEGGTTDSPSEVNDNRVVTGRSDHLLMVTGFDFYGHVSGGYAAQVVRLADITVDEALVEIAATSATFYGAVIRRNDPTDQDYAIERSASATEATATALPDPSGGTVYGIGSIIDGSEVTVIDDEGDEDEQKVRDTDRWLLDLSDRTEGTTVSVAIQLDRHFADDRGVAGPNDPWIAVAPAEYVPTPTEVDTVRGECEYGGYDFSFPSPILEHLYFQMFLSPSAVSDDDKEETGDTGETSRLSGSFDPCGEASESATTCADDWDLDGVTDADEPLPGSLLQQIHVVQCTLAGNDATAFTPLDVDIVDTDELDEDTDPYVDRTRNLGGQTGSEGEEAFIEMDLSGGEQYLIVVGAGTGTGVYELSVQELD